MSRIFQNYIGSLDFLIGKSFSKALVIKDNETNDTTLIWLFVSDSEKWLRIFIDGAYCGVDVLDEFENESFLDNERIEDVSDWFAEKSVIRAEVLLSKTDNEYIKLILDFGNTSCTLVCKSDVGDCELFFD